jgi:integrase
MAITEKNGKFYVSVYRRHPITRKPVRAQKIVDSHHAAVRAKAELDRQLLKKFEEDLLVLNGGKMLYKNLLPNFYQSLRDRDLAEATIENYKLCLDAHTLKRWGNRPIDEILPDEIRTLVKVDLADRSRSHQKSMRKFLNGVFTYAVEAGHLHRNPVPFMQFRIGAKLRQVFNETQANMFLGNAKNFNHEWYPIWATAIYTGMRNEELYALRWQNVDLENRKIYVRETWTKKGGFQDLTKNGEDRVVEIAPPLLTIFKELKIKNADSTFVLPRIDAWDGGRQAEILRIFLAALNLPLITFHDLRGTWTTIMLSRGVPPVKVMKMGGWKTMQTMLKHYVRASGIDIKGITDDLVLHDPSSSEGKLIELPDRSNL